MSTDAGGKRDRHNEDKVGSFVPTDEAQLNLRGALYAVADGMGGHNAGEVASEIALNTTIEAYYAAPDTMDNEASLRQAIAEANSRVHERSQESDTERGMGTTIVAAVVHPDGKLLVANVGDSRAYLIRNGKPTLLSVDHSWVTAQIAAGILTPEQAKTHKRRHQITRSLGPRPQAKTDISSHKLEPGDTLVLCSDGLTDVAGPDEVVQRALIGDAQAAAEGLVDLANSRGTADNVTALIVCYGEVDGARKRIPFVAIIAGAIILLGGGTATAVSLLNKNYVSPTPTAAPTIAATRMALAAATTPSATHQLPAEEPTREAPATVPEPTRQLVAPATPTPEPTNERTATRTATVTLTATHTPEPTSTPEPTPTAVPTSSFYAQVPVLTMPGDGQWLEGDAVRDDSVRLQWGFGKIGPNERFEVRVWAKGLRSDSEFDGLLKGTANWVPEFVKQTEARNLAYKLPRHDKYAWTVVVVRGPEGKHVDVSKPADMRWFGWVEKEPAPAATQKPTPEKGGED